MAGRRSALGRGLEALIPGPQERASAAIERAAPAVPTTSDPHQDESATAVLQLPVAAISPNPDQPRRHFDAGELARLAKSLRDHGVLQPVVVRSAPSVNGGPAYELLVGERRWRAAQQAGLETLPALLADVAAPDRLELALVENVQRSDLNPIELALAFQGLADTGWTQEKIGQRVGFDRSSVSNHMRLLDLSPEMQQDLEAGRLQMGHAKALLAVTDPASRRRLRDQVVRDQLSVRHAEAAARKLGMGRSQRSGRPERREADVDEEALVRTLRNHLKTQVRVRRSASGGGGRIEIDYSGASELERLIALILPS